MCHDRTWSTLAQVMACCLMALSHYLNQCWLIIKGVLWYSLGNNFTGSAHELNLQHVFRDYTLKITTTPLMCQWSYCSLVLSQQFDVYIWPASLSSPWEAADALVTHATIKMPTRQLGWHGSHNLGNRSPGLGLPWGKGMIFTYMYHVSAKSRLQCLGPINNMIIHY